jgi:hypothetical protein
LLSVSLRHTLPSETFCFKGVKQAGGTW